ncbi:MAG: lytic murein transglycosylase B [Candidatus Competibacteraceae bacterium]|nr:lytic murein transglycosylase B [Candidatus Competibacteraceae bacterium]
MAATVTPKTQVTATPSSTGSRSAPPPPSVVAVNTAALPTPVPGSLASRADVQAFIEDMVAKHGFSRAELYTLFSRARSRDDIIELITRPAEGKPWHAYRKIFLTNARIGGGVAFWNAHRATLTRAEQVYGVPAEIIVAIIGVETSYGGNTGSHRVLDALATLAFDYPRRADFFRKELEHYLVLTREEGIDPLALKGSYAGAMGLAQFMPSSYRSYAVDFDADQHRNLWTNPTDAIGSVANYLSEHRWQRGQPIAIPARVSGTQHSSLVNSKLETPSLPVAELRRQGVEPIAPVNDNQTALLLEYDATNGPEYWLGFQNFYVITRYNRSQLYAMAVYQLGQEIRRRL